MWARACLRVPEARQHRFIHHRNEERAAGVEKCGEKLEASRVLDAFLAGSGRHGPAEFLVFRTARLTVSSRRTSGNMVSPRKSRDSNS